MVQPSRAYSSKDMPAHTQLKERAIGQGNRFEANKIDFKAELLQREKALLEAKGILTDNEPVAIQDQVEETTLGKRKHELGAESDDEVKEQIAGKRVKTEQMVTEIENPFA